MFTDVKLKQGNKACKDFFNYANLLKGIFFNQIHKSCIQIITSQLDNTVKHKMTIYTRNRGEMRTKKHWNVTQLM